MLFYFLPTFMKKQLSLLLKPIKMIFSKKYFFILILSFFAVACKAQQFKERVYLKDSITFYEGYVIEQSPAKYVKIYRLVEKDTITVPLSDVLKLTKIYVIDTVKLLPTSTTNLQIRKMKYEKVAFVELLGAAGLYSINYDMRTEKGRRDGWGFRVGIEKIYTTFTDTSSILGAPGGVGVTQKSKINFTAVPLVLNYLFGKRKGFLELGVGATYFHFKSNSTTISVIESYKQETFKENFGSIIGSFNIGYRHVPYKAGFMYKVSFTPLLLTNIVVPFFGFGLGYHFK